MMTGVSQRKSSYSQGSRPMFLALALFTIAFGYCQKKSVGGVRVSQGSQLCETLRKYSED